MNQVSSAPRRFALSRELGICLLLLLTIVLYRVLFPVTWQQFATLANFAAVTRNLAFEGVLALGMMMLLVSGTFDLSVGATASMVGVVTGWLMKHAGWPVPAAVAAGLALGAVAGLVNGIVIARVRVNALITTLGTMGIYSGAALLVGGPGITFLPPSFARLGQAQFLGVQTPVWLLLGLGIAAHYALAHTRFFRQYYYVGSNAKAARLSGLRVERLQVIAFTLVGALAGLAGIVYAARVATASSTIGAGKELGAITACILGGASLQGGRGTAWGALLGVLFVAVMQNMLLLKQVRPEWQDIILGLVLVFAVAFDSLLNRKQFHP
ncbi:MAG: ABC transporter permease [Verrucomicrobia bacterium]|nr:ABC transporter permease [Verrucomicrobiota bacterium]